MTRLSSNLRYIRPILFTTLLISSSTAQFGTSQMFQFGIAQPNPIKKIWPSLWTFPESTCSYSTFADKGTSFTNKEREDLGLVGLLPPKVESLTEQSERVMDQIRSIASAPLSQYSLLNHLYERNQRLFYFVLSNHIRELAPIVYTPTVGKACQEYSKIWEHQYRGMFLNYGFKGRLRKVLDNWKYDDVEIIVVTDGSRILGLGDLGLNGMGIPVGKLDLYVAAGGFDPTKCLPITIDVGTNNEIIRNDKHYLGLKQPRVSSEEFYSFMEEFMLAVHDKWPRALVQFEDFATEKAFGLLDQWRDKQLCFNDDIQGTAAMVVSGFISSLKYSGSSLRDEKLVFFGARSAGVGVANLLVELFKTEMSESEALSHFYMVDSKGLITTSRGDKLSGHKQRFARQDITHKLPTLEDVIKVVKPTTLLGLSGQGGSFTNSVLRLMGEYNKRPIIFALSNPTSSSESTAAEAYEATEGRALFAGGSPFPVWNSSDGSMTRYPGQGNNMYIFPGLGFGGVIGQASKISDSVFIAAAHSLANSLTEDERAKELIYPTVDRIREVSVNIATDTLLQLYAEDEIHNDKLLSVLDVRESVKNWVKEEMFNVDKE